MKLKFLYFFIAETCSSANVLLTSQSIHGCKTSRSRKSYVKASKNFNLETLTFLYSKTLKCDLCKYMNICWSVNWSSKTAVNKMFGFLVYCSIFLLVKHITTINFGQHTKDLLNFIWPPTNNSHYCQWPEITMDCTSGLMMHGLTTNHESTWTINYWHLHELMSRS